MAVVAVANTSTYIQGGIEYSTSTSSSGITVTVRLYFRRTNVWSGPTNSSSVTQSICISSSSTSYGYSQTAAINVAGGQQNVWQGPYFTASRTFEPSRGGGNIYVGWKTTDNNSGGYFNNTSGTVVQITLPTTATAPTGLTVANIVPSQEGFSADVSVTGWGGAGSASTRYRELQVWTYSGSGLTEPRRYQNEYGDALTSSIIVNNSTPNGNLTILPNTEYVIGAYATNGTYNTGNQRLGVGTTLPPSPSLSNTALTPDSATFVYSVPNQGGKYDMALKYQIDGGELIAVDTLSGAGTKNGTFTVSGLESSTTYSIVLSLSTSVGEVTSNTINFTTESGAVLYGPVNGQTKKVKKLYGSVNGQTKEVVKLYGSVGGQTKRIF